MAAGLTGEAVVRKMLALRVKHRDASQAELHGLFRESLSALPPGAAQWFGDADAKGRGRKVQTILDRAKKHFYKRSNALVLRGNAGKWYEELWAPDGTAGITAWRASLVAPAPPIYKVGLVAHWSYLAHKRKAGSPLVRAGARTLYLLQARWEGDHDGALFLCMDLITEVLKFVRLDEPRQPDKLAVGPPAAKRARNTAPTPTAALSTASTSAAKSAAASKGAAMLCLRAQFVCLRARRDVVLAPVARAHDIRLRAGAPWGCSVRGPPLTGPQRLSAVVACMQGTRRAE